LDKKDIKLIAIDVDGTLLNSKQEMTPRVEKALRDAIDQGVMVVFATGKTRNAVQAHIKKLDLNAPGIFVQGLVAYDTDGKLIHNQTLEPRVARQVITFAEDRGFALLAYSGSRILAKTNNKELTESITKYHEMPPEVVGALQNLLIDTPINKLMAVGDAHGIKSLRWQLNAMIGSNCKLVQAAIPEMLEILPPQGSKGTALKVVCKHYKISADHVLAIGDAENDIEMIQYAGIGVAMGNAEQKVKDAAKYTVASHDEDGVAEAIERFVLKAKPMPEKEPDKEQEKKLTTEDTEKKEEKKEEGAS